MYYNKECKKDEIFVGNMKKNRDMSYLSGVNYRIGSQAYDIDGKKISSDYMLPLFISKSDFNKYDKIMMEELRKVRMGYLHK